MNYKCEIKDVKLRIEDREYNALNSSLRHSGLDPESKSFIPNILNQPACAVGLGEERNSESALREF